MSGEKKTQATQNKKRDVLFETEHCSVALPSTPHVDRLDGGHIVIHLKRSVSERWELTLDEAVDLMMVSMCLGEAMMSTLRDAGIPLRTINFQDNGNWAFLRGENKKLHIHLYGRAENSRVQDFGQELVFPDLRREPEFYNSNVPLTPSETFQITKKFDELYSKRVAEYYSTNATSRNTSSELPCC